MELNGTHQQMVYADDGKEWAKTQITL